MFGLFNSHDLFFSSPISFLYLCAVVFYIQHLIKRHNRRTVERVETVTPAKVGHRRETVELDLAKQRAVQALVEGWGMSRKGAAAALAANGFDGYPDWEAMTMSVLAKGGPA